MGKSSKPQENVRVLIGRFENNVSLQLLHQPALPGHADFSAKSLWIWAMGVMENFWDMAGPPAIAPPVRTERNFYLIIAEVCPGGRAPDGQNDGKAAYRRFGRYAARQGGSGITALPTVCAGGDGNFAVQQVAVPVMDTAVAEHPVHRRAGKVSGRLVGGVGEAGLVSGAVTVWSSRQ